MTFHGSDRPPKADSDPFFLSIDLFTADPYNSRVRNGDMPSNDSAYHRLAMRIFADFGASIAVPAVLGALLGKWLDARYGTSPRWLILCLAIAVGCTAAVIVRKARRYGREYERLSKNPSDPNS